MIETVSIHTLQFSFYSQKLKKMKATIPFRKCTLIATMVIGSFPSHIPVIATKPDLVISSFSVNGPNKTTGVTTVTYTVGNRPTFKTPTNPKIDPKNPGSIPPPEVLSEGPANINGVTVNLYWKKDGAWVKIGSKVISSTGNTTLESGKSISGTFTTTSFTPTYSTQTGQTSVFDFELRVDESNKVLEYNETNNTKTYQMNVPG